MLSLDLYDLEQLHACPSYKGTSFWEKVNLTFTTMLNYFNDYRYLPTFLMRVLNV